MENCSIGELRWNNTFPRHANLAVWFCVDALKPDKSQNTNWPFDVLHVYRMNVVTSTCAGQVSVITHS